MWHFDFWHLVFHNFFEILSLRFERHRLVLKQVNSKSVLLDCAFPQILNELRNIRMVDDELRKLFPPLHKHAAIGLNNLDTIVLVHIVARSDHHTACADLLSTDSYH